MLRPLREQGKRAKEIVVTSYYYVAIGRRVVGIADVLATRDYFPLAGSDFLDSGLSLSASSISLCIL
jgi:hypothetical protein